MPVIEKIEESSETFDPLAEEVAVAEPVELQMSYAPWLVEVELPITWTEYFLKLFLMMVCMFFSMLVSIWVGQEGMLYNPQAPIQYMEQNPQRYQSPD